MLKEKKYFAFRAAVDNSQAVFALLGADVTVVDIAQGQLDSDIKAATRYGYEINTVQGDMRDLSELQPESFDIVYAMTPCYVPEIRRVYSEGR